MSLAVAIGGSLDRDVRGLPPAPLLRLPEFGSKDSVSALLSWFVPRPEENLLLCLAPEVEILPGGIERLRRALGERGAALAYSDYLEGSGEVHPLIDYQPGSLRDDFDFGALLLIDGARLRRVSPLIEREAPKARFAGWYETRLRLSELGPLVRVGEPLYRFLRGDDRPSGQKVFDYLDPRRRDAQREMEEACTRHLRRIGAWRPPPREPPLPDDRAFPVEASVVIPVKNRARTIADAVQSALSQQTTFAFNVIVVDNHSEDGTGGILDELSRADRRLVPIVPERTDLGIGGCWNLAVASPACGRYAVQLDSDDLYDGPAVLQRLVDEFSRERYAMVIGSYTTVDFSLRPVPPGLVDHAEWTEENGHNNALRVGGLGAPRAFHTPTLRSIGFPDASYAEDYAVGLRMCRRFRIGRIFESLYWCRRWEDNTDARLSLAASNRNAYFKDTLRTEEIRERQKLNQRGAA